MKRWIIPIALAALAAVGLWLVFTDDDGDSVADGAQEDAEPLDIEDTTRAGVAGYTRLSPPPSTADFLTARLDDGSQLDITFTMSPNDESVFVEESGLPTPEESDRYITHSSPLWKLNPEAAIRGTQDEVDGLIRSVEMVDEDDVVRVRAVITRAA